MKTKTRLFKVFKALAICGAMLVPALVVAQVTFTPNETLTADKLNGLKSVATRVMSNVSTPSDGTNRVSSSFATRGGTLVITVSATAFRATAGQVRIDVLLFGGATIPIIGSMFAFASAANSHVTFPSNTIVTTQPAGTYTIQLRNSAGTLTNADDYANITALEITQ